MRKIIDEDDDHEVRFDSLRHNKELGGHMSDSEMTGATIPPPHQPSAPLGSASGLAIASMVLGIVGIVFAFLCYPIGFVLAVVGLPLGGVALSKINKGTVKPDGKGQAITGLVLSIITLAVALIMMIAVGAALNGL